MLLICVYYNFFRIPFILVFSVFSSFVLAKVSPSSVDRDSYIKQLWTKTWFSAHDHVTSFQSQKLETFESTFETFECLVTNYRVWVHVTLFCEPAFVLSVAHLSHDFVPKNLFFWLPCDTCVGFHLGPKRSDMWSHILILLECWKKVKSCLETIFVFKKCTIYLTSI